MNTCLIEEYNYHTSLCGFPCPIGGRQTLLEFSLLELFGMMLLLIILGYEFLVRFLLLFLFFSQ